MPMPTVTTAKWSSPRPGPDHWTPAVSARTSPLMTVGAPIPRRSMAASGTSFQPRKALCRTVSSNRCINPAKPTPISQVASAEDPSVLVATTAERRSWTRLSSCLGSCACGPAEMQPDTLSQSVTFPYRGWSSHGIYQWLLTLVSCIPKIHPTIERFCTCSCTGAAGNRPPACQSHTPVELLQLLGVTGPKHIGPLETHTHTSTDTPADRQRSGRKQGLHVGWQSVPSPGPRYASAVIISNLLSLGHVAVPSSPSIHSNY
jgi:hypothetical protein